MLIKNTGHKIVHIGSTMILPDQTREVEGELAAPLNALIERGALEVVKDTPGGIQVPGTPVDDGGSGGDGGKDTGKKNGKQPTV